MLIKNCNSEKLFYPKNFDESKLDKIDGGCGPGGIGDYFIPDTIWGIYIRPACKIHDFQYHFGDTEKDKKDADDTFLNNMIRIIEDTEFTPLARSFGINKVIRFLAKKTAQKYYFFVSYFGGPAFWDVKNTGDN